MNKADEAAAERILKAGVRRAVELLRGESNDPQLRFEVVRVLQDAANAAALLLGERS